MPKTSTKKPKMSKTTFESRAAVPSEHRWKLDKMFKSVAEWNKLFAKVQKTFQFYPSFAVN